MKRAGDRRPLNRITPRAVYFAPNWIWYSSQYARP